MKILATLFFFIIPALGYAESSTTASQVGNQPDAGLAASLPTDVGHQDYANSPPAAPESTGTYYDFWKPKSTPVGSDKDNNPSTPANSSMDMAYSYTPSGTSATDYYYGGTGSYYDYSAPYTGSSAPDAPDYKIPGTSQNGAALPPPLSSNCLLDDNGKTELTQLKTVIAALLKDKPEQFKSYLKSSIERCPKANLGYHRKVQKSLDAGKSPENKN